MVASPAAVAVEAAGSEVLDYGARPEAVGEAGCWSARRNDPAVGTGDDDDFPLDRVFSVTAAGGSAARARAIAA
jgi:hypothetical protein